MRAAAARSPWGAAGRGRRGVREDAQVKGGKPRGADAAGAQGGGKRARARRKEERALTAYERARNACRNALAKVRLAQAMLEAYERDGWGRASRERVRPVAELAKARARAAEGKLAARAAVRVLWESGGDARIPSSAYDAQGELDEADIFCGKCGSAESTDGNDIVLCDGECGRAYHFLCVDPPLCAENLPADDEGWLCPACDCLVDCIYDINGIGAHSAAQGGVPLHTGSHWSEVFPEADAEAEAARAELALAAGGPASGVVAAAGAGDDDLLPSDGEEGDEDFMAPSSSSDDGSSSDEGSTGDDSGSDASDVSEEPLSPVLSPPARGSRRGRGDGKGRKAPQRRNGSASGGSDVLDEPAALIIRTKRRRQKVDYAKLNEELFGTGEAYRGELLSDVSGGDAEYAPCPGRPPTPCSALPGGNGKGAAAKERASAGRKKAAGKASGTKNGKATGKIKGKRKAPSS